MAAPLDTKTASTLTLAKQMLMDLDRTRLETPVLTATLELLLSTLVEMGWPGSPVAESAQKTVMGYVSRLGSEGAAEAEAQTARAAVRY
jgi:hypothetical protein